MCDNEGKYLYCANRGHDSIVCYGINSVGLLNENSVKWYDCNGKVPRHFEIDPTNNYLVIANQEGVYSNISIFKINHNENGKLEFLSSRATGCPSWIQFIQKPKNEFISSKL